MRRAARKEVAFGWAAATFVIAMLVVLFPPREVRRQMKETIVHVAPADEISEEDARAEAEVIIARAEIFFEKMAYSGRLHFEHFLRLEYIEKYTNQLGGFGSAGLITINGRAKARIAAFFVNQSHASDAGAEYFVAERDVFHNLLDTDTEYLELNAFRPEEIVNHRAHLWKHLAGAYPFTVVLAFFYHLCLLAATGRRVLPELASPDRLFKAAFLWPIHFWYHTREPREQFRRALYTLVYALSAALCFLPVSVRGQSNKKKVDGRPEHSLQIDARSSFFPSAGPPDPTLFTRVTFNGPGFTFESVNTVNPRTGNWYSITGGGLSLTDSVRSMRVNVLALAGVGSASAGPIGRAMIGGQLFMPLKRLRTFLAIPVARYEYDLEKGDHAVALGANPSVQPFANGPLAKFSLAPDVFWRKPLDDKAFWFAGVGVRYAAGGRKFPLELAAIRDSLGQWQLRTRAILTFAF